MTLDSESATNIGSSRAIASVSPGKSDAGTDRAGWDQARSPAPARGPRTTRPASPTPAPRPPRACSPPRGRRSATTSCGDLGPDQREPETGDAVERLSCDALLLVEAGPEQRLRAEIGGEPCERDHLLVDRVGTTEGEPDRAGRLGAGAQRNGEGACGVGREASPFRETPPRRPGVSRRTRCPPCGQRLRWARAWRAEDGDPVRASGASRRRDRRSPGRRRRGAPEPLPSRQGSRGRRSTSACATSDGVTADDRSLVSWCIAWVANRSFSAVSRTLGGSSAATPKRPGHPHHDQRHDERDEPACEKLLALRQLPRAVRRRRRRTRRSTTRPPAMRPGTEASVPVHDRHCAHDRRERSPSALLEQRTREQPGGGEQGRELIPVAPLVGRGAHERLRDHTEHDGREARAGDSGLPGRHGAVCRSPRLGIPKSCSRTGSTSA